MTNLSALFVICFWNDEIGIMMQSSSVYSEEKEAQIYCDELNDAEHSKKDNIHYRVKRLDDYIIELERQEHHQMCY